MAFEKGDDLAEIVRSKADDQSIDCVLIDEAQFLTRKQVSELGWWIKMAFQFWLMVCAQIFAEKLLRGVSIYWRGLMIFGNQGNLQLW